MQKGLPQLSSSGSGPYKGCADNMAACATKGPDMNATGGGGYGDGIALILPTEGRDEAKCFFIFVLEDCSESSDILFDMLELVSGVVEVSALDSLSITSCVA